MRRPVSTGIHRASSFAVTFRTSVPLRGKYVRGYSASHSWIWLWQIRTFITFCHPIEVKLGVPDPASLLRLEPVRGPNWRPGRVLSLALVGTHETKRLSEEWRLSGPERLPFDLEGS
jgi:hypothetical protein